MVAAGVLAVGEIFTLSFFLGPGRGGRLVAAIVALAGAGLGVQLVVFILVAAASLARPAADRPAPPAHPGAAPHRHRRAGRRARRWCSSGSTATAAR